MKTLTLRVPDELAVRLEKRAKRIGVSKSALVRKSIEREFERHDSVAEEASAYDLMKDGFGCVKSGIGDLSTNPKHLEGIGR